MTGQEARGRTRVRHLPAPPKQFDPFTAAQTELHRYGLPPRPDPRTRPGEAELWDRQARRYQDFDHLDPVFDPTTADRTATGNRTLGPDPIESCGYQLTTSTSAPFTILFVTWTVPNLRFATSPFGVNHFRTFCGLGFLDVHVEMSVDSSQQVTSQLWAQGVGFVNLPVRPGDVLSASLCLNTNAAGTASYFFTNETSRQTMNFSVDTGFPPAVTVNAGVSRGDFNLPVHPLAQFGVVYFDEISAYTTAGTRSLTSGQAITMVESNGATLATPVRLTDFTFKTVYGT
ncbi:G1 family glutamic endopeptidase [Micromonospora zhanjiangensis]|uniref:G1 family glutamic endopeptidase n=1 Tax=Micromonospora zhanjiangensis TaxID=1522057 RepID=A0ABV8KVY2_9ACTN